MKSQNPIFSHPILKTLQKCDNLNTLKQTHAQILTIALSLQTYILSHLLTTSSKISITYALTIFNSIPSPTIFLYNTLISSLTTHTNTHPNQTHHLIFSLYNRILNHHTLQPNTFTFPSLFKACASHPSCLHYGPPVHTHLFKFLHPPFDHFIQSSLLSFYAKYGKMSVSMSLFNQITQPDLATWNTMLAAFAHCAADSGSDYDYDIDMSLKALNLFNQMQLCSQIRPNEVTLVALITACSNLSALNQGAWVHCYALRNNLKLNRFVGTALVDMYSKCGSLNLAYQLFDQLSEKDTFCYNAMIGGFAIHGHGNRALEIYRKMKIEGLVPDAATFVVTMFACSHVGLIEEGLEIFESMKEVHGMEPKLDHYGCLIDLLGRGGRLKEAEKRLKEMPIKPNAVLWRSLLGAARVHGNLEIGEAALEHLIELEQTSGNYVLLSNMYASIGRWNEVKRVRMMMKDRGVNKLPGSSLVEINGIIHEFLTCDKTHPFSKEIYLKIVEINRRLQEYGYRPRTSDVLFDVEEEDKEDVLSYHSERLAIAFALIASSASSSPIRITKNLRVCGDCHDVTKLISAAYQRDIIVRDRIRFHHFKDGSCSCLDYW